MRVFEVFSLSEDDDHYMSDMETDMNSIIVALISSEKTNEIDTETLVNQLNKMGYNVSLESLINDLSNNPFVEIVNNDVVQLKGSNQQGIESGEEAEQNSQEVVSDLADKAAKKDIG